MVADERTNSVLVAARASQRLRLKALIAHLDTPLEAGGDTQVRYLRYADAEKIAAKLQGQMQGIAATAAAAGWRQPAGGQRLSERRGQELTIWAEPQTNALVITAPPKIMRSMMAIIDRLDIRRAQVLVEAILVEMTVDKSRTSASTGVGDRDADGNSCPPAASPADQRHRASARSCRACRNPASITAVPSGLTSAVGRIVDQRHELPPLIRALRGDGNTNIISTPSVGHAGQRGSRDQGRPGSAVRHRASTPHQWQLRRHRQVNPFQTIQREEVGMILKITPQINEGDSVMLKIEQEASSLAASRADQAPPT